MIYPVKSLPGVEVDHAILTAGGGLAHDREYALVDKDGRFINGKRKRAIHRLDVSCAIDGDEIGVTIRNGKAAETFRLGDQQTHRADLEALEKHLSQHFTEAVRIERDLNTGFPDDLDFP